MTTKRLTVERLTDLADKFEARLAREAHSRSDLVNALQVVALTLQVRADEITPESAQQP